MRHYKAPVSHILIMTHASDVLEAKGREIHVRCKPMAVNVDRGVTELF